MVDPLQGYASLANARILLQRLADPRLTPRVSGEVRKEARALLRNYPAAEELAQMVGSYRSRQPLAADGADASA
jgi:hypothetical protein